MRNMSGTDWMEIRFTEVLINLAEAACGLNKLDEAYAELKRSVNAQGWKPGMTALWIESQYDPRRDVHCHS